MSATHHEIHFEDHIVEQLAASGWLVGDHKLYDRERALYPEDVIGWISDTHPQALERLTNMHGQNTESVILERLTKVLGSNEGGTIKVLRKGFSIAGAGNINMSQALPEDARNETVSQHYAANRLRVVRQVRYSLDNENAIDLVLFINGIPVATLELKTDFTQSVEAAKEQYRNDRKPKSSRNGRVEPLLAFKRGAVVHFAMSDSEVYMTTKLAAESTFFLPFNKGHDEGAGNPPSANGEYPVAYMWHEILQKDAWLRIFHRFVLYTKKEEENSRGEIYFKESIIFPRFHQLRAVNKLANAVKAEGVGHQYLIQHSAGSGKTNTISWLSHELIRLRHESGQTFFDSVVVVTDRTVLDAQLQEAIAQIDHQRGVVKAIDREKSSLPKSQQLAQALLSGTPIIVVTLQTFPHAMEAILTEQSLQNKRFAVIMDEAHNSQTGSSASKLRQALAMDSKDDMAEMSPDDILEKLQSVRGMPKNVSHFAFTATPKHTTLSLFGRLKDPSLPPSQENPPIPFDSYTMQQAIEEEFILDVLQNYTSYKAAFKLGEAFVNEDNTRVDEKYARRALARWLSLHPTNVVQKVELIIEHFHANVAHLLNGQAKAMVVTSSRAAAVKYKLALDKYVQKKEYKGIRALVAFSGEVLGSAINDPDANQTAEALKDYLLKFEADAKFTEDNMNATGGRDLRKAFDTPEYQVMLVANKFQTGFDQPKLVAMYLDKAVSGVEAVQTLSRLNRTYPGKDKTFVLDFANDANEIIAAFKTYYKEAKVSDIQKPDIVYDMKERLDDMQIYDAEEVRQFGIAITEDNVTHQRLFALTQNATDRFNGRMKMLNDAIEVCEREYLVAKRQDDTEGAKRADARRSEHTKSRDALLVFSEGLGKFVRAYEYVAQLVDFGDAQLEAFASYAKLLKKRLKGVSPEQVDLSGLTMTHYKIVDKGTITGGLKGGDEPELSPIKGTGGRDPKDRLRAFLKELIAKLNDAFGKEITDQDKVAFAVHISEKLRGNETVMAQVMNNPLDQAMRADLPSATVSAIVDALGSHQSMATRLLSDEHTRKLFTEVIYQMLKSDEATNLLVEARSNSNA